MEDTVLLVRDHLQRETGVIWSVESIEDDSSLLFVCTSECGYQTNICATMNLCSTVHEFLHHVDNVIDTYRIYNDK